MRLTKHIHIVGSGESGLSLTNPFDCTVYLVDGGKQCALIDAGVGVQPERILEQIRQSGVDPCRVNKILLTHGHGDHAGGAWALSRLLNARVYAMEPAARFIREGDVERLSLIQAIGAGVYEKGYQFHPCPVSPLEDEEEIRVGEIALRAVVSEGHSAGHCCYLTEDEGRRVLFAGDAVRCGGRIALQAIWDCNLQKYVDALRRLNALRPDVLLPAHGAFALERGYVHLEKACRCLDALTLPPNAIGE